MAEELNWKERYVLLFMQMHKDDRYNTVAEFYKAMGISRHAAVKIVDSLGSKGYLYWRPRNPDGKYYVLLK